MDTIHTPSMRKKMLKLSAQDLGESRRRWQHVTEALAKGDIETASEAKHIVRDTQLSLLHYLPGPFPSTYFSGPSYDNVSIIECKRWLNEIVYELTTNEFT